MGVEMADTDIEYIGLNKIEVALLSAISYGTLSSGLVFGPGGSTFALQDRGVETLKGILEKFGVVDLTD
jgi:hypothetical protein